MLSGRFYVMCSFAVRLEDHGGIVSRWANLTSDGPGAGRHRFRGLLHGGMVFSVAARAPCVLSLVRSEHILEAKSNQLTRPGILGWPPTYPSR